MTRTIITACLAILLNAHPGLAQTAMPGMASMTSPASKKSGSTADTAMTAGMASMNHAMAAAPMTGNADQDFVAMMIPHHAGAVSMAQVELRYGHDPYLRKLATQIIAAQEQEIADMKNWQKQHPAP